MSLKINIEKSLSSFDLKINFEHKKGILGLLGASGSGKSMTLKSICGLITPDKGSIILNNNVLYDHDKRINLKPQKRNAGYLFQNYALFPNMTVEENIESGLFNVSRSESKKLSKYYIEKLNLKGLEKHYPGELSGGQMQRTAFARAIAPQPDILLLDEPFSALDVHLKSTLEKDLIPILKEYKGLVIMVSHDIDEAYRICDEIIVYDKGTSLPKRDKEDLFRKPQNLIEARITGCQNIFKCKKIDKHNIYIEDLDVNLNLCREIKENINYIGIRSHSVNISKDNKKNNCFKFNIKALIKNPFSYKIYAVNKNNIAIEIETDKIYENFEVNDTVYLSFIENFLFFF